MLATILKSKVAIEVSVSIMDAFVAMRHYILKNQDIYKSLSIISNKLSEHDEKLNSIFSKFDKKEYLFLPGQVFDAYSTILDLLNESKKEIIIVDAYADKTIFDFIKNIHCKILLITSDKANISDIEINKFNLQYNKLKIIKNNTFHD